MTDNYSIAISREHGHGQRLGTQDGTAQYLNAMGLRYILPNYASLVSARYFESRIALAFPEFLFSDSDMLFSPSNAMKMPVRCLLCIKSTIVLSYF